MGLNIAPNGTVTGQGIASHELRFPKGVLDQGLTCSNPENLLRRSSRAYGQCSNPITAEAASIA